MLPLTKKERNQLKAIAATLPVEISKTKEKVIMDGWRLLQLNPIAMDDKGKPIVRNKKYTVDQFKPINHYKLMFAAFQKGGVEAVDEYCNGVKERWDLEQKNKEKLSAN